MLFANRGGAQWLIAFLGNPGPRYAFTRHNAGFLTADEMEKLLNIRIDRLRFRALTATAEIAGEKVLLMKPQTFMNLSGEAVGQAARFYKIPPEHVLVVSDEVSLPVGSIRIRLKGSAGGHNGLKSVISHLGTDAFPRVRLGVGVAPNSEYDMADWVLSTFRNEDAETIRAAAEQAAKACVCFIEKGPDKAMTQFNTRK